MSEGALRRQLADISRLAYDRRLTFGAGGNLSARLDADTILITPSGMIKGLVTPEQLIQVDVRTERAAEGKRPSMETPFHTALYRTRADVGAVVHLHPPSCTALAVLSRYLRPAITPEGVLVLGDFVPTIKYASPGSEELAQMVVDGLGQGNAALMQSHGALAVGKDLLEAFGRMETMEYLATLQLKCEELGDLEDLPEEEVGRMLNKK
jgi:L-fuculose-phosphate aldolase